MEMAAPPRRIPGPARRRCRSLAGSALPLLALAVGVAACGDEGPAPIDRIEVSVVGGGPLEVMRGETIELDATPFSGETPRPEAPVTFTAETPGLLEVDSLTGTVRGLDFGEGRVAVRAADEFTTRVAVPVVGEPVATLEVAPADTGLVVDGTVTLVAVAEDDSGRRLIDVELAWSSGTPEVAAVETVGGNGRVTGLRGGTATVEVEAWNGVRATGTVRVLPVTGISPDSGAFGERVTLEGSGLPGDLAVAFPAEEGGLVDAETAARTPDGVVVWVPVGAADGPLHLTSGEVGARTASPFTVTGGGDDALEENDVPSFDAPVAGIGFRNPALVAGNWDASAETAREEDWYIVPVERATGEFTVEIEVRKGSGFTGGAIDSLLHAFLYRLEGESSLRLVGGHPSSGAFSYSIPVDSAVRTLRFARRIAEPDTFFLRVIGRETAMPYALSVVGEGRYAIPADGYEENDAQNRAAGVGAPVTLEAAAENGGELDYFEFTLTDSAALTVALTGGSHDLDLWLGRPDVALEEGIARRETTSPDEVVQAVVGPGTYVAGVWDFSMIGDAYTLGIAVGDVGAPPVPAVRFPDPPGEPAPGAGAAPPLRGKDGAPDRLGLPPPPPLGAWRRR